MIFSPLVEVMIVVTAHWLIAWTVTYLIHSTVLIAGAFLLDRLAQSGETRSTFWQIALIGGVGTATIQLVVSDATGSLPLAASQLPPVMSRVPGPALIGLSLLLAFLAAKVTWALGKQWLQIRRLRCQPLPATSQYRDMLADLVSRAGLASVPNLTASKHIGSPAVIGRRDICLPLPFFATLPSNQQEALIAHELGHVARADSVWLMISTLFAKVLFVQPLNGFALARLRSAVEDAADEYAIRLTDSVSLAGGLVALAPLAASRPPAGTAAGGAAIFRRVTRILTGGADRRGLPPWLSGLIGVLGLVTINTLGPGIGGSPDVAANAIPWLAPSRDQPNSRMLEIRRFNRSSRDFFRELTRGRPK